MVDVADELVRGGGASLARAPSAELLPRAPGNFPAPSYRGGGPGQRDVRVRVRGQKFPRAPELDAGPGPGLPDTVASPTSRT